MKNSYFFFLLFNRLNNCSTISLGDIMKFCVKCGNILEPKELKNEGLIPFCSKCNEYRFEQFNVAVSMVILNKDMNKTLFIEQYGKSMKVLVAGYVNKGESAEDAVRRELFEEVGLNVHSMKFQISKYHEKSGTLMLNYLVIVEDLMVLKNFEVDRFDWYDLEEAYKLTNVGSLAKEFYDYFYEGLKCID